jgi:thiol-disulfide isomerase/thioredoxin
MPVFLEALTSGKSEQENASAQPVGIKAPTNTAINFLPDSLGLKELIAKNFKGKIVLIDCWATWCKWCIVEFPAYKQYDSFMKENNIVKLFISFDKGPFTKLWQPMVLDKKIEGQHVIVNDKIEREIYSITHTKLSEPLALPRYILIGPDGKVLSSDFERPSSQKFYEQLKSYTRKFRS